MGEGTVQCPQPTEETALYLDHPNVVQSLPVWSEFSREMTIVQGSFPVDLTVVEGPQLIYWVIHLLEGVGLSGTLS